MNNTDKSINSTENVNGMAINGIKKGRKNLKNKIQFGISLNEEQKNIKSNALQDTISVFIGKA